MVSEEALQASGVTPGLESDTPMLPPPDSFESEEDFWKAKELTFRAYHDGSKVGEALGLDRDATVDDVVEYVTGDDAPDTHE